MNTLHVISWRRPTVASRTLSKPVAYALSAAIIGAALFASATPSPLYQTYARLWGFSSVLLTLIYATYAIGVLVYSIGGLFFALGPELSARVFDSANHLVSGISLFLLAGVGAVAQLAYGRRAAWFGAAAGSVALALGVLLIVLAAANNSAAALIVGSIVGGVGFGLAFLGSLRALSARIPPSHRAGVMSAFFLAAYAALSAPAVLAGLLARPLGLESTFEILGSMDAALALVVAAQAWRTRPRTI